MKILNKNELIGLAVVLTALLVTVYIGERNKAAAVSKIIEDCKAVGAKASIETKVMFISSSISAKCEWRIESN